MFYNFALRKQFWHKNASIGLTAANPFNQYVNVTTTTYGSNFNESSLRQIPLRSFGISLMYKFGKLEFKKDSRKTMIMRLCLMILTGTGSTPK